MALTKKWAANGIKTPIPNDPQGDNLVNYDEGFTTPYRTPIKDGGVPIGMGTFNQLMFDITDEVIENKKTLNQVAQRVTGLIDDTQTSLTATWSSQLIDNKISTAAANIIDDNQTTGTLTWSSLKISAEIGQGGGGSAVIDDNTITTDKVWSSFKTNQMVKGGKTISITNFQTKTAAADTEFVNSSANAQVVNLNVKVKTTQGTTQGSDKYLGDIVVYYNSTAQEVLRESVISQNITGAPNDKITSALGSVILDAQDTLLVKGVPDTLWTDVELEGYTANLTTEAPEPEPLGEGLIFTAQASSSSVTFNKQGTPTELQLEYQTIKADVTSGWQPYTLGTTIDLDANDKVAFRNTGTQTITQTANDYHYFTMAGEIKPENSISFLFDSTGTHDSIGEYECYKMFANCSALAEMPDLPATNIAANGYANMFEGCTKLKTIKPLNATTITNYSYKEMFKNCSELLITETEGETSFLSMPASAPSNAADNMFIGTGGTFTGTPTANSSYYYNAEIASTEGLTFTNIDSAAVTLQFVTATQGEAPVTLNLECKNPGGAWSDYDPYNNVKTLQPNETIIIRNKGLQNNLTFTAKNYIKLQVSGNVRIGGSLNFLFSQLGADAEVTLGAYGLYQFCHNNKNVYGTLEKINFLGTGGGALGYAFSGSNINEVKGASLNVGMGSTMFNSLYAGSAVTKISGVFYFTPYSDATPKTGNSSIEWLFRQCLSLQDASNATITIMLDKSNTYFLLPCDFSGSTSLKKAPKFITISSTFSSVKIWYDGGISFFNCSSLTIPPVCIKSSSPRITQVPPLSSHYFCNTFQNCSMMRVAPLMIGLDNFIHPAGSNVGGDSAFRGTFYNCSSLKISKGTGDVLFWDYNGAYGSNARGGTDATFGNTGGTYTGSVQTAAATATQAKFYYQIPSDLTDDEKEFLRNQRDYMISTGDSKYKSSIANINTALEAQK